MKRNLAATIAIGCLALTAPVAQAAEDPGLTSDGYERFQNSISYQEYQAGVQELASLGLVESKGVVQPLDRPQETALAASSAKSSSSHSGGGGTVNLGTARHVGDVFYSPSITGHNGIWYSVGYVVEANPSSGVRAYPSRSRQMNKGTQKMYVRATQSTRNAAGAWAHGRVGSGYNYAFFNNKKYNAPYNCSQLVWAAYHRKGIDLDSNGGWGVYPRNIRDDSQTVTYATLN